MTTISPDRSRHPREAAMAALAFALVAFVVKTADGVIGVVYMQGVTLRSLDGLDYASPAFGVLAPFALWQVLPMAVGVFLSFWLLLPLRPAQRTREAILRSLGAVAIGLALAVLVAAIRLLTTDLPVNPMTQGGATDNRYYLFVAGGLANDTWQLFVDAFAMVVAVGLALWGWMRVRSTSARPVDPRPERESVGVES
jgi:hypothetical protein